VQVYKKLLSKRRLEAAFTTLALTSPYNKCEIDDDIAAHLYRKLF
jgi:hypothetical protein